ncbi:MAG: hypothetical protein ACYDA8_04925 [Deferrisomatales bacterium]
MDIVRFAIGEECFPIYRTLTRRESRMLRALLGDGFVFPLTDGDPLDKLLFDVLTGVGQRSDFFFALPPEGHLLGTFALPDDEVPAPPPRRRGRRAPLH